MEQGAESGVEFFFLLLVVVEHLEGVHGELIHIVRGEIVDQVILKQEVPVPDSQEGFGSHVDDIPQSLVVRDETAAVF